MAVAFEYVAGQTPLDPDEAEGLIPGHIATQGQLNEWEAENILEAQTWALSQRRLTIEKLLDEGYIRKLHKRMFGKTWRWAGTFRKTEKNIGVAPEQIAMQLTNLCRDAAARLNYGGAPDETAAWFHHRLVFIHAFSNGNGRHARLLTDLLLIALKQPPFDWGAGDLVVAGEVRARYLDALRCADGRDYSLLRAFVRSGAASRSK